MRGLDKTNRTPFLRLENVEHCVEAGNVTVRHGSGEYLRPRIIDQKIANGLTCQEYRCERYEMP
jgi:hypothetical protein